MTTYLRRIHTKLGYGRILDGNTQDSDYLGDNRTLELSRSNNGSDKGQVFDVSFGADYRFAWGGDAKYPHLALTPQAGYFYHQQNLRMHDAIQTVSVPVQFKDGSQLLPPPLGPFDGLNSRYDAEWREPWAGLRVEAALNPIQLFGDFSYHWASYHGQGTWNLREDFQQPKSFSHHADGTGYIAALGLRYLTVSGWGMELGATYQNWTTDTGNDETFFHDNTSGSTQLNRIKWESAGGYIGLRYFF